MISCDRSAARHYGDERGRYWSVSQVCDVVCGEAKYYQPGAAQRGTDVHLIFALAVGHSVGLCDAPEVPTEYQGYYRGIMGFIGKYAPQPTGLEQTLSHPIYPMAGTLDFVGRLKEEFCVLDLKSGGKERRHELQIEAYRQLVDRAAKKKLLYIDAQGRWECITVKPSPGDWAAIQNGISILQWREQQ